MVLILENAVFTETQSVHCRTYLREVKVWHGRTGILAQIAMPKEKMKTLYFDINGTLVLHYECKSALAGGAFRGPFARLALNGWSA